MTIQNEPFVSKSHYGGLVKIERQAIIRLGVINSYGQPYYHDNTAHARIGIMGYGATGKKVERDAEGDLIIKGAFVHADEEVGTLRANLDESLARDGFWIGASGTATNCELRIYKDNPSGDPIHIRADDDIFAANLHNVWWSSVGWLPEASLPATLTCPGFYLP